MGFGQHSDSIEIRVNFLVTDFGPNRYRLAFVLASLMTRKCSAGAPWKKSISDIIRSRALGDLI